MKIIIKFTLYNNINKILGARESREAIFIDFVFRFILIFFHKRLKKLKLFPFFKTLLKA